MAEAKYAVKNGDSITGILWENEKLGRLFVLQNDIDPNFGLEILDLPNGNVVKEVDMIDFLLEILPYEQAKKL